jgi:hypothetical protein
MTSSSTQAQLPRLLRRVFALLQSGVAAFVLAGLLLIDAWTLPDSSGIVQAVDHLSASRRTRRTHCYTYTTVMVVRDAAGRLQVTDDPTAGAAYFTSMSLRLFSTNSGFWAPTRHAEGVVLLTDPSAYAPGEEPVARALFADYLLTFDPVYFAVAAPRVRSGSLVARTAIPAGYVHNAAAALAARVHPFDRCACPSLVRAALGVRVGASRPPGHVRLRAFLLGHRGMAAAGDDRLHLADLDREEPRGDAHGPPDAPGCSDERGAGRAGRCHRKLGRRLDDVRNGAGPERTNPRQCRGARRSGSLPRRCRGDHRGAVHMSVVAGGLGAGAGARVPGWRGPAAHVRPARTGM